MATGETTDAGSPASAPRDVWTCDTCSRTHLRSIEGKLDSAWW